MTLQTAPRNEIALQMITLPDPELTTDAEMFLRGNAGIGLDLEAHEIDIPQSATADFGTYFNLFNLGIWSRSARLDGLTLWLSGVGRLSIEVMIGREPAEQKSPSAASADESAATPIEPGATLTRDSAPLVARDITLTEGGVSLALGELLGATGTTTELPPQEGLLWLRITGLEGGVRLTAGSWTTRATAAIRPDPIRLAISVTSFRREAETARTARRVTRFLDTEAERLGIEVDLIVIDNGRTLDLPVHPRLRVLPNANLGGAGGFARGLAEARAGGYSHVLFMDDDASFAMENLRRTIAFLRLARSPRAAVAGAMISTGSPWAMWENGAVFNRRCQPMFIGSNLHDPIDVGLMELHSAREKPANFYGGWWYFAFPIAAVAHDPFPFFVRGDDISFSLANRFDTVTLSGVVSFQEDFAAKESPLTLYLDLRNHLHHHLVHDSLDIGAVKTAGVALRFILRGVIRMHYDGAEAMLAAWEDVMKGPEFFARNADMSVRRPEIQALNQTETWQDLPSMHPNERDLSPPPVVFGRMMKFLLNGQLLPFFGLLGRRVQVPVSRRGAIWPIWGAREATFYDASGRKGYTVRHDKRRGWSIMLRAARLASHWIQTYEGTRIAHRVGYDELTSPEFWQAQFSAATPDDKAAQ